MTKRAAPKGQATVGKGLPWPIRAVQLDLARHMETVDYVCRYADLAAEQGFNTLVLYIEARVRTKSFPFRPREETYSLDDMARVVGHAAGAGMDVVPVVSTLGHCEQFLACKELAPWAEERDGRSRWGSAVPWVFCPSLDETYEFFGRYFSEMAQVFTGPSWHAGLDEDWDLGYCHLCRARWEKEGLGALFADHVRRVEAILRGLGKRMWMWDDMFEFFPEELANIPKNIVMAHWQYDELIEPEGIQAHFANRSRRDWLAEYRKLGLDAIICPAATPPRNIETFTDYGRRHPVLGGLLTQWEGSPRFHAGNASILAFTGKLWSSRGFDPTQALEHAVRTVLPNATVRPKIAVKDLIRTPRSYPHGSIQNYLYGRMTKEETLQRSVASLTHLAMKRDLNLTERETDLLDYLDWSLDMEILHWNLRELIPAIYDPRRPIRDTPRLTNLAEGLRAELGRLLRRRAELSERLGFHDHPSDQRDEDHWHRVAEGMKPAWDRARRKPTERDWWAVLRLFLQDYYGAPKLKVTVTTGSKEFAIIEGTLKPPLIGGHIGGHYDLMVPFESRSVPDGVRLEGWGYGGQGVAFVELQSPTRTLMPSAIRAISGPVVRPEAVLRDDSAFAYLGCPDVAAEVLSPALAEQRAMLDLGLAAAAGVGQAQAET